MVNYIIFASIVANCVAIISIFVIYNRNFRDALLIMKSKNVTEYMHITEEMSRHRDKVDNITEEHKPFNMEDLDLYVKNVKLGLTFEQIYGTINTYYKIDICLKNMVLLTCQVVLRNLKKLDTL